jgi:sulfite exporter TauE/SafE
MGMCGGFALAVAQASGKGRPFVVRQSFYYLGKTVTYTMLGIIAGGLGAVVSGWFSGMQQILSIGLGLLLVSIGMSLLGWLRPWESGRLLIWMRPITRVAGRQLKRRTGGAAFALGLVNGLLPCGLVYGALALAAASGTASGGALRMAAFGLATIPALFVVAGFGAVMQPMWRSRLNRVSGVLLILLGLLTIARGIPAGHASHRLRSLTGIEYSCKDSCIEVRMCRPESSVLRAQDARAG